MTGEQVQFLDVHASYRECEREVNAAVQRVLQSGCYVGGPEVEGFEEEFATYVGARHCVAVGNGLDALTLSLMALGIGAGDEVVVPSHTFVATWLAVGRVGATVVPVEVDPATFNLDVALLEEAITGRTKAIMPVHLYGQPADLEGVLGLARRRGLYVIEDAAQAHGATHSGKRIGSHSDLVCWSFYPGKNLGAFGDAGGVSTDDEALATRLRRLRNYGSDVKYLHEELGVNSRMDPIQAAVLRVKLPHLDEWNLRRSEIASTYLEGLSELTGVELPYVPSWAGPVWHLFVIKVDRRDQVRALLAADGIETLIHYPTPPNRQACFSDQVHSHVRLPIAEQLAGSVVSLPIGPHLHPEDSQKVISGVKNAVRESRQ